VVPGNSKWEIPVNKMKLIISLTFVSMLFTGCSTPERITAYDIAQAKELPITIPKVEKAP
jgi:PBP1b-binding outer membrane lipoprotein LpoB